MCQPDLSTISYRRHPSGRALVLLNEISPESHLMLGALRIEGIRWLQLCEPSALDDGLPLTVRGDGLVALFATRTSIGVCAKNPARDIIRPDADALSSFIDSASFR